MLICVTNSMRGHRCALRGQHLDGCPWVVVEDEAARRGIATAVVLSERFVAGVDVPKPCTGCLPYRAEVGMLCRLCDDRFRAALYTVTDLVSFLLSGGQRPVDVNRARGKPVPRLPIKDAKLAADSLWTTLAGVAIAHASGSRVDEPEWPAGTSVLDGFMPSLPLEAAVQATADLVTWVEADQTVTARHGGAEAAVEFYRQVQQQLARFPLEEKPKRVPYLRCRSCGLFAVVDRPPLQVLGVRVHECSACGATHDPQATEFDLAVYRQEVQEALGDLSVWPEGVQKPHDRAV